MILDRYSVRVIVQNIRKKINSVTIMTYNSNCFLTYSLTQSAALFMLLLFTIASAQLTREQKIHFYEDCTIFNDTKLYGGEICGSDGETYSNSLFLDCINHHGSGEVGTLYHGKCRSGQDHCELNPIYKPVCGSDNQTWSNVESLLCHNHVNSLNLTVKSSGDCITPDYCERHGVQVYGLNPVCGSNGYTYQNIAQLKCLQKKNTDLRVMHDGGCRVSMVHKLYGLGAEICNIAKHRYEWNPLCASDNVTYPNPFVFLCYKPHLRVHSNHECGTVSHDACIVAHTNTSRVNGEYVNDDFTKDHEVCGNDGRTYKSVHHIHCQSLHNKYLHLKHWQACGGPDDNPCASVPDEDGRFPVCGTDGVAYVSPEALWCVKRRSPERKLAYLHDGPC